MTRAFVAVRLPEPVLDALAARVAPLAVPGRPTTRGQWHVTLQFLGDDADVDGVAAALDGIDAAGGSVRLGGAGAFPGARRASVRWMGFAEGAGVLARVAAAVAQRTAAIGYPADARAFRPHVTLSRLRPAADARAVIAALGTEPVGAAWPVDAVTVYESRRRADGARYEVRATVALAV